MIYYVLFLILLAIGIGTLSLSLFYIFRNFIPLRWDYEKTRLQNIGILPYGGVEIVYIKKYDFGFTQNKAVISRHDYPFNVLHKKNKHPVHAIQTLDRTQNIDPETIWLWRPVMGWTKFYKFVEFSNNIERKLERKTPIY